MDTSLQHTVTLLETYRYAILFPITVLEGPIAMIIAGLLVSLGYFEPVITCIIIVVADNISDILRYYLGLSFRHEKAQRILSFVGVSEIKIKQMELRFNKYPKKLIFMSKVLPGIGMAIQVAAGTVKASIKEYVWITFIATLLKTILLMFVGYIFGNYINQINNFFSLAGVIFISVVIILYFIYRILTKYAEKRSVF